MYVQINMASITEQLDKIGADIMKHLKAAKIPLTQKELYQRSDLGLANKSAGLSDYGWPYALQKLERAGKIEMIGVEHWKLKKK